MRCWTALESTTADISQRGRGILAADESAPTIAKHFKAIDVKSTEESRRAWRALLVTMPGLGEYISGISLFEETLTQNTDDKHIPTQHGIEANAEMLARYAAACREEGRVSIVEHGSVDGWRSRHRSARRSHRGGAMGRIRGLAPPSPGFGIDDS